MTDKEYAVTKKKLEALRKKWVRPLGLAWWLIDFIYAPEPLQTKREDREEDYVCAAETACRWQYSHAKITFNMPHLCTCTDKDLEHIFVHELMHIFLNETRNSGQDDWLDHEERVAETLANAFMWARDYWGKQKK